MKIQFYNQHFYNKYSGCYLPVAEFDVAEPPTEEQCAAIEEEIWAAVNAYAEENDDDMSEFDYWSACRDACNNHLEIINNPVVKTFYI